MVLRINRYYTSFVLAVQATTDSSNKRNHFCQRQKVYCELIWIKGYCRKLDSVKDFRLSWRTDLYREKTRSTSTEVMGAWRKEAIWDGVRRSTGVESFTMAGRRGGSGDITERMAAILVSLTLRLRIESNLIFFVCASTWYEDDIDIREKTSITLSVRMCPSCCISKCASFQ